MNELIPLVIAALVAVAVIVALAGKNNIAVTPGDSVTITIPATAAENGAVRIMWGVGRAYPSTNTADM